MIRLILCTVLLTPTVAAAQVRNSPIAISADSAAKLKADSAAKKKKDAQESPGTDTAKAVAAPVTLNQQLYIATGVEFASANGFQSKQVRVPVIAAWSGDLGTGRVLKQKVHFSFVSKGEADAVAIPQHFSACLPVSPTSSLRVFGADTLTTAAAAQSATCRIRGVTHISDSTYVVTPYTMRADTVRNDTTSVTGLSWRLSGLLRMEFDLPVKNDTAADGSFVKSKRKNASRATPVAGAASGPGVGADAPPAGGAPAVNAAPAAQSPVAAKADTSSDDVIVSTRVGPAFYGGVETNPTGGSSMSIGETWRIGTSFRQLNAAGSAVFEVDALWGTSDIFEQSTTTSFVHPFTASDSSTVASTIATVKQVHGWLLRAYLVPTKGFMLRVTASLNNRREGNLATISILKTVDAAALIKALGL